MKTELRVSQHSILRGQTVIELWWEGRMIGQITGADGPGVRVISKYPLSPGTIALGPLVVPIHMVEVRIG